MFILKKNSCEIWPKNTYKPITKGQRQASLLMLSNASHTALLIFHVESDIIYTKQMHEELY